MSHGRWWGSLLPLNHLRTAASPCPRWFPLKFGNFCQDMEWQRMVVWASILQSTADIRHLYRFAKEIHQKKAKSMVFQYSKYLVDFNKISPIPSWKKPWDTNLTGRTSRLSLSPSASWIFRRLLPSPRDPIFNYRGLCRYYGLGSARNARQTARCISRLPSQLSAKLRTSLRPRLLTVPQK